MQLAAATSRRGQRAVLIEADIDRGGLVQQADNGPSILDCLAGRVAIRDALEPGPDGIWVLPGAWAPQELGNCTASAQDRLLEDMRSLSSTADLFVVDLGSSRNPFVRRFWRAASMVVVVSSPDASSVQDSYAAIKVLLAGETSIPVYTLVNFAANASTAVLVHERLRATCKRFLGLRTSSLGEVPESASEHAFEALAETLCDELGLCTSRTNPLRMAA
jgi:flagellar biosynthesis protein FlhG